MTRKTPPPYWGLWRRHPSSTLVVNGTPDEDVGLNLPTRISRLMARIRQFTLGRETVFNSAFAHIAAKIQSRLVRDEEGATAVEYGLIVGLIAVVIIVAVGALGGVLSGFFTNIVEELGGTVPAGG
jgi:pilus assembly protein Flp/PilA